MKRLHENPMTRMKQALTGIDSGIRSFGIMTAENPMGQKYTKKQNIERQQSFQQHLQEGLFQYIRIKGKYGNLENPFVILNINIDELLTLGAKYDQESVIFARNYFDYVEFQYWEQSGDGNFKLLDTSDYFTTLDDPEDFYSYKRDWKFNIPFPIFESMNTYWREYNRGLSESTRQQIDRIWQSIVEEDRTLSHYYRLRAKCNYFLHNEPMKLVNRDGFTESKGFEGYWVKYSKVYDVDKHITFILRNPELFNMTKDEIRAVYQKYGEKIGQEGKAREEIIIQVAHQGWIRVRHYQKPEDYWTIQFDRFGKRKYTIDAFIDYALENLGMHMNDAISLLGYDDGYSKNYSFQEGGISAFLMEVLQKKPKKV